MSLSLFYVQDIIVGKSLQVNLAVYQISEFCDIIRIPFLQQFNLIKQNMCGVKYVMVGKSSLSKCSKLSLMCVFCVTGLCEFLYLLSSFALVTALCSQWEKRWLIVHTLWLLQWKVAVVLWWCHLWDWSYRAFQWHAHIGLLPVLRT